MTQARPGAVRIAVSPSYLVIASRALAPRSPPRTRYGSRPRRGSQPAYRPWPIRPCLPPRRQPQCGPPPSTHADRGPGGFLRDLVPRTDERGRCPQWFSAVSDRTGCSTASNWSKDPRSTVRPAQRSVMPRSARSCRRARTVTADGMTLPREQCVGSRRRQATGRRSQAWRFC